MPNSTTAENRTPCARPSTTQSGKQNSRGVLALIEQGYRALEEGRPDAATDLFLEVAESAPAIAAAWHGLGLACEARGALGEAAEFLLKACGLEASTGLYWRDLGRIELARKNGRAAADAFDRLLQLDGEDLIGLFLRSQARSLLGDHVGSIDDLGAVLRAQPESTAALNSLGNVMRAIHRLDEAAELYRSVLQLDPEHVEAWHNLGAIHALKKEWQKAAACESEAIHRRPSFWQGFVGLGLTLSQQKLYADARICLERALAIAGDQPDILIELGNLAVGTGDGREAIDWYRRAMNADPTYTGAIINAANLLRLNGATEEALRLGRSAVELEPKNTAAHNLLGNCLGDLGKMREALQSFQRAAEISPADSLAQSNLLYNLNFHLAFSRETVSRIHRAWGEQEMRRAAQDRILPCTELSAGKRLRIGYVSGDFRRHSVMYFLDPILRHHDRNEFEVYCYSNLDREDEVTASVKASDLVWRDITAMTDSEACRVIAGDQIDILVDLAGHTGGNRLGIFARKPAPLQISYLGYPNTTGLSTLDYRIVDAFTDPDGLSDGLYSERLLRIRGPFLCFSPPLSDLPVAPLIPEGRNGYLTFGTFNNNKKLDAEVISAWCEVLAQVPGAKLLLKGRAYQSATARDHILELCDGCGIGAGRIQFRLSQPSLGMHLRQYDDLDIALDTYPYNGTTTTFEALWMGVPVLSWCGETHASRVGNSILRHLGHPEWVAASKTEYVERCLELASQPELRRQLRQGLRAELACSELMQQRELTERIESAYREMWKRVCATSAVSLDARPPGH